jgi:hypothetical protein
VEAANQAKAALATATGTFNAALGTEGTKSLEDRISAAGGTITIYLYGDENFAGIPSTATNITGKDITLEGVGAERTITLSSAGSMFRLGTSGTLTLDNNVTLKGIAGNNAPLIFVSTGGTLNLQEGAKITSNIRNETSNIGNDSNQSSGSGVQIIGGTFNMTGGTISGNYMVNEGGGGVYVRGTFTMSGGTISGNTAAHGAGVFIRARDGGTSTFNMSGSATISGNTAENVGGGVWVNANDGGHANTAFNMTGGTISGNAAAFGGGVGIMKANLTKTGGTISGNTVSVMEGYTLGNAIFVAKDENETIESVVGYRNSDAGTGDDVTITWDGSEYTTTTGLDVEVEG